MTTQSDLLALALVERWRMTAANAKKDDVGALNYQRAMRDCADELSALLASQEAGSGEVPWGRAYERVREEFQYVARLGGSADIDSAMLNVDALIRACEARPAAPAPTVEAPTPSGGVATPDSHTELRLLMRQLESLALDILGRTSPPATPEAEEAAKLVAALAELTHPYIPSDEERNKLRLAARKLRGER